jgi:tetratricopeptide (TPR) repeat protein
LVAVLFVLGYPALTRDADRSQGVPGPSAAQGTGGSALVDLTSMPLEEQALTLFDRVMRSASAGDTADVAFFLPKALVVHEQLAAEDADGIFHFGLLHLTGGDYESALAKAREGLERVPEHLLLLGVAGEAAAAQGDSAAAREYYGSYVDLYEAEMGMLRSGYEHHQPLFPVYLREAQAYLTPG